MLKKILPSGETAGLRGRFSNCATISTLLSDEAEINEREIIKNIDVSLIIILGIIILLKA